MRNRKGSSTLRLGGAAFLPPLLLLLLDLVHAFGLSAAVSLQRRRSSSACSPHLNLQHHRLHQPSSRSIITALASEIKHDSAEKTKYPTPPKNALPPPLPNGSTAADNLKKDALPINDEDDPDEFLDTIKEAALQVGSDFKDAALKVGGDLFVALRWGAANALTKSLPPKERDELLRRVQPENPFLLAGAGAMDEEETELLVKNSVNEAVAAALAEESQREEARWEREKEALLKQAQEAAKKRVESDLAVQKQRLEQEKREMEDKAEQALFQLELERERALREKEEEQERLKKELAKKMQNLKEEFERKGMENTSLPTTLNTWVRNGNNTTDVHPILGPILVDLGYKRIHTVSAEKLATIPVWKKQRIYRHNRAKAMAQDKLKTLHLGLPGVICLHEEENGKLAILDGQHRVGMMSILQEKQKRQQETTGSAALVDEWIDLDNILVEVYPQTSKVRHLDHAQDIFLEINKAEPVRVIDMPGVATKKDRSVISLAVNNLELKYPTMFSPSQRCRAPNLNIDNLRDSIFAANIIKRHNLKTGKQLLDWMIQQNEALGSKLESDPEAQGMFNAGAWSKASSNKFYLGLESSWLYN